MVSGTSTVWHSRIGLPLSRLSSTASSWRFSSISLASFRRIALRSAGASSRQRPSSKASLALPTAKSTSAASQAATSVSTLPVAGFTVGKVFPEAAGRQPPSMKALPEKLRSAAIAAYSAAVRRSVIGSLPR